MNQQGSSLPKQGASEPTRLPMRMARRTKVRIVGHYYNSWILIIVVCGSIDIDLVFGMAMSQQSYEMFP